MPLALLVALALGQTPVKLSSCPPGERLARDDRGGRRTISCTRRGTVTHQQLWQVERDGGAWLSSDSRTEGGLERLERYDGRGRLTERSEDARRDGGVVNVFTLFHENGVAAASRVGPPGEPQPAWSASLRPSVQRWPDGCLAAVREGSRVTLSRRAGCPPSGDGGAPVLVLDPVVGQRDFAGLDGGALVLGRAGAPDLVFSTTRTALRLCVGDGGCVEGPPQPGVAVQWSADGQLALTVPLWPEHPVTAVDLAARTIWPVDEPWFAGPGELGPDADGGLVDARTGRRRPTPCRAAAWTRVLPDGSVLCMRGGPERTELFRAWPGRVAQCLAARTRDRIVEDHAGQGPIALQLSEEALAACREVVAGLVIRVPGLDPVGAPHP